MFSHIYNSPLESNINIYKYQIKLKTITKYQIRSSKMRSNKNFLKVMNKASFMLKKIKIAYLVISQISIIVGNHLQTFIYIPVIQHQWISIKNIHPKGGMKTSLVTVIYLTAT